MYRGVYTKHFLLSWPIIFSSSFLSPAIGMYTIDRAPLVEHFHHVMLIVSLWLQKKWFSKLNNFSFVKKRMKYLKKMRIWNCNGNIDLFWEAERDERRRRRNAHEIINTTKEKIQQQNLSAIDSVWFVKVNFFLSIHQVNLNEVWWLKEEGEKERERNDGDERRKKLVKISREKNAINKKLSWERDCAMCALMKQSNWKIDDAKLNMINFDLCAKYKLVFSVSLSLFGAFLK